MLHSKEISSNNALKRLSVKLLNKSDMHFRKICSNFLWKRFITTSAFMSSPIISSKEKSFLNEME